MFKEYYILSLSLRICYPTVSLQKTLFLNSGCVFQDLPIENNIGGAYEDGGLHHLNAPIGALLISRVSQMISVAPQIETSFSQ